MNLKKGSKIISDIIIYDNNGNGNVYKYLLDTGADITFISENIFSLLKLNTSSTGSISVGNNTTTSIKLTKINISFLNHKKYIHVEVGVMPNKNGFDVILGMDLISYCNIHLLTNNNGFNFNMEMPLCK